MKAILLRTKDTGKETLGIITLSDNSNKEIFRCFSLERPWKQNIKCISCIPKGSYLVKWTFSPKFMRYTYRVMDVPGRDGILIHPGNYFFDVEGCILLGQGYSDLNKDGEMDIINSTITLRKFEQLLNKQSFILNIN